MEKQSQVFLYSCTLFRTENLTLLQDLDLLLKFVSAWQLPRCYRSLFYLVSGGDFRGRMINEPDRLYTGAVPGDGEQADLDSEA